MMKHPDDKATFELPGISPAKRGRGRPAKYGSSAERQAAYRRRKMGELDQPVGQMSRVTLIKTLSQSLASVDDPECPFTDQARDLALLALHELKTRYEK